MESIRVLVASDLIELRLKISQDLAEIEQVQLLEPASGEAEAEARLQDQGADVVLVDNSLDGNGYAAAQKLHQAFPGTGIILIEETIRDDTLHRALLAGANDVLIYPFEPKLLLESITRSAALAKEQAGQVSASGKRFLPKTRKAEVITVFSPKGGVGKTLTSINEAVSLYQQTKSDVALVDFDLDYGTVALGMNLQPFYTLSDILEDMRNINAETISSYLTPHESGVLVLPGNAMPRLEPYVRQDQIAAIIAALRDSFDFVVIDMPSRFSEELSPALTMASRIFLIATPEISTLRNIKASLVAFGNLGISLEKVKVVLNRADLNRSIRPNDVAKTLEREIYGSLRDDSKSVIRSMNEGKPLVASTTRRGLVRDFELLTHKYLSESGRMPTRTKGRGQQREKSEQ